jgi:hypothetical protein
MLIYPQNLKLNHSVRILHSRKSRMFPNYAHAFHSPAFLEWSYCQDMGILTLPPSMSRLSRQYGILNISQPYRPPWPITEIAWASFPETILSYWLIYILRDNLPAATLVCILCLAFNKFTRITCNSLINPFSNRVASKFRWPIHSEFHLFILQMFIEFNIRSKKYSYIPPYLKNSKMILPINLPILCLRHLRHISQFVLLSGTHFGHATNFSPPFCYEFIGLGRPLWRVVGSVVLSFCWTWSAQPFSGLSPAGLMNIFYCL